MTESLPSALPAFNPVARAEPWTVAGRTVTVDE
jgi:hypothetical protein